MCHRQVLAIGFLLVILSAALFKSYLTLLVVATYVVAPLPNWLCGRAASHDDFMESHGSGIVDLGRFLTGFFVVMGIGKSCRTGAHDALRRLDQIARGTRSNSELKKCLGIKALTLSYSSPHPSLALGADCRRRSSHVRFWRSPDICHYYQLHAVLPGARRLLTSRRDGIVNTKIVYLDGRIRDRRVGES